MILFNAGLHLMLGLSPVFVFLLALIVLDSYKLVRLQSVAWLIVVGGLAAMVSLQINSLLVDVVGVDRLMLTRYVAPVIEELLKGAVIVYLMTRRRIGFLVDAAISGFAVGAGFAALENIHYFTVLDDPNIALWVVRGFGTALMHGSVTATMAIVAKQLADTRGGLKAWHFLPGLAIAVILHSFFNHFIIAPDVATVLILIVLPVFFAVVFRFSELRTRDWLGTGFDTDSELLEIIGSGKALQSRIGSYLGELKDRFEPTVVADMLCLLRLRLELSIRAKGILLARQAGFSMPQDPQVEANFTELHYLENNIGRTGMFAMSPLLHFSDRDLWQYHMLGKL